MVRALGIPAGIAVIALLPVVVAGQEQEPAQRAADSAPEPEARESALSIQLSGSEGGSSEPAYIAVTALGSPPEPSLLADASGEDEASVTSAPDRCQGEAPRSTGIETDTVWCLELTSVDRGVEMTGTAEASDAGSGSEFTQLTLTATRKDDFWPQKDDLWPPWPDGFPLLVLAAGIIAGALAIIVPVFLLGFVRRVRLARVLERNRRADPSRSIADLDGWVKSRLEAGKSIGDLIDPVTRAVAFGPGRASEARAELGTALDGSRGLPARFMGKAREEANKIGHQVSDLLKDDLSDREQHPAAEWTGAVGTLNEHAYALKEYSRIVEREIAEKCRQEVLGGLGNVQARFNTTETREQVSELAEPMRDLEVLIEKVRKRPECKLEPSLEVEREEVRKPVEKFEGATLDLSGPGVQLRTLISVIALAVVAALILGYAGLSLYYASYAPNATFHSNADYFSLFSAAVASGAAGAVIELLGYWRPDLTDTGAE